MSHQTSTSNPPLGPHDPTCRRGVSVFPATPKQVGKRRNLADSAALPTADDGFARPIENAAAYRATRLITRGPHVKANLGGGSVGLKAVEVYGAQDINLDAHTARLNVAFFNDRVSGSANLGRGPLTGLIAGRFLPDAIAGVSFLGTSVGGGYVLAGAGLLSGDIGINQDHYAQDLGCREDNSPDWYKRIRVRSKNGTVKRTRSAGSLNDRPNRDIEIKDSIGYALSAVFVPPNMPVPVLFRLDGQTQTETRLMTRLDNETAWQALYKQSGLYEIVRGKLRPGVRHQDIVLPTLQEPERLSVGAKLSELYIGSMQGSLLAGLPLLLGGVQGMHQNNRHISVRRESPSTLKASYNTMAFSGRRWFGGTCVGTQGTHGKFNVGIWNYGLAFNASLPGAEPVYNAFTRNTLPGSEVTSEKIAPWRPTVKGALSFRDLEDVAAFVRDYNGLQSGATYQSVRHISADYQRRGVALRWYFFPTYFLYQGMMTSVSREAVDSAYEEHGTDGTYGWRIRSLSTEKVAERGLRGLEVVGASCLRLWRDEVAEPKWVSLPADSSLFLTARYYGSRTNATAVNNAFIAPLNRAFRLQLKPFTYVRTDLDRSIEVECPLTDKDLERLVRRHVGVSETFVLAQSTGLSQGTIETFLGTLTQKAGRLARENLEDLKGFVQSFVQRHGMPAFGLIHQLLGRTRSDLHIATMSDLYQQAHKRAQAVAFRYRHPLDNNTTLGWLRSRYLDVTRSLQELDDAVRVVEGDPFLSTTVRRDLQSALRGDSAELRVLLGQTTCDNVRNTLASRLQGAWYRPWTARIFAHHLRSPAWRYASTLKAAAAAVATSAGALTSAMSRAELRQRFAHADTHLPRLQRALRAAQRDILLSHSERRTVCAELRQAIFALAASTSCNNLTSADMHALRHKLNNVWWQTSGDKRILEHLDGVEAARTSMAHTAFDGEQREGIERAYGVLLHKADEVTTRHEGGLQATMSADDLRRRFKDCEDVLRQLQQAIQAVDGNQVLTWNQRVAARAQLSQTVAQVRACLSDGALTDVQRTALRQRVEQRWWKTTLDGRIVNYLRDSKECPMAAAQLREADALGGFFDTRRFLKQFSRTDALLDNVARDLEHDVLRAPRRTMREYRALQTARDALHVDLWNRRSAAPQVFANVRRWSWLLGGFGQRVAAAFSAVPKGIPRFVQ